MNSISKYSQENFSCGSVVHSGGYNWYLYNAYQDMKKLQGFPSIKPAFNLESS